MPGSTLESALTPLGERLWCEQCREALQERIRTLIVQWSVVKVCKEPACPKNSSLMLCY